MVKNGSNGILPRYPLPNPKNRSGERAEVLADNAAAWSTWTASYRAAFYRKFPFHAPAVLPQQTSEGKGVFMACTQGVEPRPAVAEAIALPGGADHADAGRGEECDR